MRLPSGVQRLIGHIRNSGDVGQGNSTKAPARPTLRQQASALLQTAKRFVPTSKK